MLEINLLPKEYKRRGNVFNFDKSILYVGIAVAAFVIFLGGVTLYQRYQISHMDKLIAKAHLEQNRYKKDIAIIDALTEVKEKILARVNAIEKLDQRRDFYINLLEDLDERIPEFLWLTQFEETPPTMAEAPKGGAQQPGQSKSTNPPASSGSAQKSSQDKADQITVLSGVGKAEFKGYAHSLNAIGAFIVGLMKSDFYDHIKLGSAKRKAVGNIEAFEFAVSADLNYDAMVEENKFKDTQADDLKLSSTVLDNDEDYYNYDIEDYLSEEDFSN